MKKVLRNILLGSMVLLFAYLGYVKDRYLIAKQNNEFERKSVEEVAVLTQCKRSSQGCRIYYSYYMNNSPMESSKYLPIGYATKPLLLPFEKNIGRKFIVKYLPNNPEINVLLLDREVK